MKYKALIFCVLTLLLNSCGPKKLTEEELALEHLHKTDSLLQLNLFNAAKLQIDSINTLYPKQIAVRKKATTLLYQIELTEHKKNYIYADSVIKIKQLEFDSVAKNFSFEKDTAFQDIGNYVYKNQRTEYKATSTFIKAYVDETGLLYLSSNYCSSYPLHHFSAKFSIGDVYAETEKVTKDGFNHSFKDDDKTIERVIYKSLSNKDIGTLVQQNIGKTIVVTLQGEKRKSNFTLSTNEKKAISEAFNLSVILTDLKNLERIINISKKKIILLEDHIRIDQLENQKLTNKP